MPRVKKSKRAVEEVTPQEIATAENLPTPQGPNLVNVSGYGNIEMDDDVSRFVTDKINNFNGDSSIRDQFGYIADLYKQGGLKSINEAGVGYGSDDKSLTNRRASRRQFFTGNSQDYARQQAAKQYNSWLQEYAQQKYNKDNKVTPKDYSFNLADRVGKGMGGFNAQYWDGLSGANRKQGIYSALGSYFKELGDAGDYDEKTHQGIDKNRYDYFRNNSDAILQDFQNMSDLNGDGKFDANEQSAFVNKHGINPFELLNYSTPKTEQQLAQEKAAAEKAAAEKAEKDQELALQNRNKAKSDAMTSLNLKGDWRWQGDDKEGETYTDQSKWRLYGGGNPLQGLFVNPFSNLIDEYNNSYFQNGYRIPLTDFNTDRMQGHLQNLGIYDPASKDFGAGQIYEGYRNSISNITSDPSKYAIPEGIDNLRSSSTAEYQALKGGAHDKTSELPAEQQAQGIKKYVVANPDKNDYANPFITIYVDKNGNISRLTKKFKNGGNIDFNKVKKFQYGGISSTLNQDQVNARKQEMTEQSQNRDMSANRSATTDEVFGSDFKLTNADKADLAAVGLDIAGLAAGFVPGGSMVAGATGLGSTLLGAGALIARDGKLTWGNLASTGASAAMDVASLAPGAGNLAKGMKIAKWLKTSGKWATRAMQAYGYTQAAAVGMKLASEGAGSMTMQDWQQLLGAMKGIQSGVRNKVVDSATEVVSPGRASLATSNGNIEVDISGNNLRNALDADMIKGKQTLSQKMSELAEANSTNASGKTPDQIKQISDEISTIKSNLTGKLTAAGIDSKSAAAIVDSDIDMGISGVRSAVSSAKVWNKDSWRSPFKKSANVTDLTEDIKAIKDTPSSNIFLKYAKAHAKAAGLQTRTKIDSDILNLPANQMLTKLGVDESTLNSKIQRGKDSYAKSLATSKAKGSDRNAQSLVTKQASNDLDAAKNNEITAKSESTIAKTELSDKDKKAKKALAVLVTENKNLKAANAGTDDSAKSFAKNARDNAKVAKDDAYKELDVAIDARAKAKKNTVAAVDNRIASEKSLKNETKKLDSLTKETLSLAKRTMGLKKINASNNEKLKDVGKKKLDASDKLKTETLEELQKYKTSKSNATSGGKAKMTAAALVAAAGIGTATTSAASNISEKNKISKMSALELDDNIETLKKSLEDSSNSSSEKERVRKALSVYENARKKISSKKKGGVLKFSNGGLYEHYSPTVNKTLPDYIKAGVDKALNPSILKMINVGSTNRKLMNKINQLPRPAKLIAPTTTKMQDVGMASAMNQYNQLQSAGTAAQPGYSDLKLNAAAANAGHQANIQGINQLGSQLQAQSQQIKATNAQLHSQDAANRAQMANQDAAQENQFNTMMNRYQQGLISSRGQSIDQALSEWQHRKNSLKDRILMLDLQAKQNELQRTYQDNVLGLRQAELLNAGQSSIDDYHIANPEAKRKYDASLQGFRNTYNTDWNNYQKGLYQNLSRLFKSGGSLEEKKLLEFYKAEMKRLAEKDKIFNKMILEKAKLHQKKTIFAT